MKEFVRWQHTAFVLALLAAVLPSGIAQQPRQNPPQNPASPVKDGLSINQPGAFAGYSLIAPMNSTTTYLIDMESRIVNEWKSDYTPALSAYLLENGHLLRPGAERGIGFGGPGGGGRIQEFNWDGSLVWDYSFGNDRLRPHHDICPLPNGNVLVIASERKTAEEAIAAGRRPDSVRGQVLADCILEVKPTGKTTGEIVWEWHAWDHLIQDVDKSKPGYGEVSEHPELIDVNFVNRMFAAMLADPQQLARLRSLGYVGGGTPRPADNASRKDGPAKDDSRKDNSDPARPEDRRPEGDRGGRGPGGPGGPGGGPGGMEGDWMHTNSIAYNAELDQIMLSIHEFSEVWIIDHGTTTKEAATHTGGRRGKGGDLLYRWGNPRAYRCGSNADQRLFAQHCAHWIPAGLVGAGNMLVFNNGNGRPDGAYSSVDEVELPLTTDGTYRREEYVAFGPVQAQWSYTAPEKSSFQSMLISGAQRLPNGNTFICSGNQGIVFEVTSDKKTVWQYKHPGAGFGGPFPGMPGPAMPRPGEVFPEFVQQMLQMTDKQKESLAKLQAEVDSKVATLLTDDQKAQLKNMQNAFVGGPRFGPGGPGFGPPGFGGGGPGFGPPGGGPPGGGRDGMRLPGGPPGGGPGGGPGGPGGLFRSYRYGKDYAGFAGKELKPGKKLDEVAVIPPRPQQPNPPPGR